MLIHKKKRINTYIRIVLSYLLNILFLCTSGKDSLYRLTGHFAKIGQTLKFQFDDV